MDRLQKAVARAKEKKEAVVGARNSNAKIANVKYTETKVTPITERELASRRIVAGLQSSTASTAFRLLRTKILSEMDKNGWRTLAISSPDLQQGKSTIAANLAIAMAMEVNHSVLLVDLDLERPNLHRVLGLQPRAGLRELLRGESEISKVMLNPGVDRLTIIPGHGSISDSSEWISGPNMQQLFSEFRARYKSRFIVYDMPPLLDSDNVLKSIKNFDCSLLVVEDGSNTADTIRQSAHIMRQTNFLGYVLNKAGGLYSDS